MEHLWAPWRKAYVQNIAGHAGDVFAEIARSQDDAANHVLIRAKSCFGVLNAFPYNTAHCLVIPYRQTGEIDDLSENEITETVLVIRKLKTAITQVFSPHGFNIGLNLGSAAGAGITDHLHWHLVPRWRADVNFITTTGDTRVHPNELDVVYRLLQEKLEV